MARRRRRSAGHGSWPNRKNAGYEPGGFSTLLDAHDLKSTQLITPSAAAGTRTGTGGGATVLPVAPVAAFEPSAGCLAWT